MKSVRGAAAVLGLVLLALVASAASAGGRTSSAIVFSHGTAPNRYDVWTVGASGRQPRRVTRSCMWDWWPDWSPNRTRVAFARACPNGNFDLYVVRVSGRGLRRVTRGPALDQWPTWSPDGSRLAFVRGNDAGAELYVVGADGKGLRRLTRNHVEDATPSWSPDGRLIVFASKRARTGPFSLLVIPAAGGVASRVGGVRRLTTSVYEDVDPDW
ncbi:MAG TPA: hypothetical protein VLD16_09530 [Gaiellaceae bacterium]|nr:hypothetical protein [Gaiellaceae bacterium]